MNCPSLYVCNSHCQHGCLTGMPGSSSVVLETLTWWDSHCSASGWQDDLQPSSGGCLRYVSVWSKTHGLLSGRFFKLLVLNSFNGAQLPRVNMEEGLGVVILNQFSYWVDEFQSPGSTIRYKCHWPEFIGDSTCVFCPWAQIFSPVLELQFLSMLCPGSTSLWIWLLDEHLTYTVDKLYPG